MSVVLTNNAVSKLASSLTSGATTLSVTSGEGSRFPSPGAGSWFPVTLIKGSGAIEIIKCTSRSGDVLTVARGQEGTLAQSFSAGDRVELRLTAGAISELTTSLTGYICGLEMQWNSGTSISLKSGSAYIESTGTILNVPSTINSPTLSSSANTWYHVYLYDNAGTPAIEVVTTAPASPFSGTARSKSGDTSRRYIGSLLSSSTSNIFVFRHTGGKIEYLQNPSLSPFQVLNGVATTQTTVNCSGCVPLTASHILCQFNNTSASSVAARLATPEYPNAITNSQWMRSVLPLQATDMEMPIGGSSQFNYAFDSAPNGALICRISGYLYSR